MSTSAIILITIFAFLGWSAFVEAVREVLVARIKAGTCPCRDLRRLKVGAPETRTRFSAEGSEALKDGFEAARWKGH